ncbi:hypothetical protein ABH931_005791 [Streptacidiphilus sp. MAP12-33]|uniref:hypothetical protein n=1 Tax=Streptacidiphilus sp. MAP12-33 TaxID=3156266 RepID=UPI0035131EA7
MSPAAVTVGHRPDLGLLVAGAADRRSARWLEQAGFVRDDALDLHRPRRDTPASVAERQLRDAIRLLTADGYGVTRVFSEAEQRARIENRPSWVGDGGVRTALDRIAYRDKLTADICTGHLTLLASHDSPHERRELLGLYAATGEGVIFYGGMRSYYEVHRHEDLDSALMAWTASGYATQPPVVGPRKTAALSSSPSRPAHAASAAPPSADPAAPPAARVRPPWPTTGHIPRPF